MGKSETFCKDRPVTQSPLFQEEAPTPQFHKFNLQTVDRKRRRAYRGSSSDPGCPPQPKQHATGPPLVSVLMTRGLSSLCLLCSRLRIPRMQGAMDFAAQGHERPFFGRPSGSALQFSGPCRASADCCLDPMWFRCHLHERPSSPPSLGQSASLRQRSTWRWDSAACSRSCSQSTCFKKAGRCSTRRC